MASRAKLTLSPGKETAIGKEHEITQSTPELKMEESVSNPHQNSSIVKGVLLAGLAVASIIVFKRKIF